MTFTQPAYLLLLFGLIPLWFFLRNTGSRSALMLKTAACGALIMALAAPWGTIGQKKLAVTALVDVSASMPRESLERSKELLRQLVARRDGAEVKLVTFADHARSYPVQGDPAQVAIPAREGAGMATNIEEAMQVAMAGMPPHGARRIVLITDGNETRGHALAAALQARQQGVTVSVVPSGGAGRLPIEVESVTLPQHVFSGERFMVSLAVNVPRDVQGRVSLTCQGKEIGAAGVVLRKGPNQVDLDARISGTGVSVLEARLAGEGEERVLFSQAVSVRRPRVLYVMGGPERPRYLADTLKRSEIDVETVATPPRPSEPDKWDALILDNYPDHRLSAAEQKLFADYVSIGGGLVFVAGKDNAQLDERPRDGLAKVLPVRGDPGPAPEQPTAVVLVLDKSASMDGLKIAMVREAARASVATLRPIDKIGVIAFDSSYRWVVPITAASDLGRIVSLIATINADGGTSIYPALAAAFEAIRHENAARKHIVLLTDGWSTPGEFAQLAQQAASDRVTISAVAVGKEVNHNLLENLARDARGKSYFVDAPETIPQILSGEVRELTVSSIREEPFRPVSVRPVEFTDGIDFRRVPRLLGFVKTKARNGSETILRTPGGEPLLVRWQYGLGRVAAFLSDARNRWAIEWLQWSDYGKFWPQLVRDVCRRNRTVRAGVRPGSHEGEAVVYYDLVGQDSSPATAQKPGERPRVVVSVAGEPPRSFALEETGPGHFEARIPVDERGLYRIVSGSDQFMLPEAGFYRDSGELRAGQVNTTLLREISRVTEGDVDPTADALLDPKGSQVFERRPLWAYWLVLALLLNFAELACRKGLFERWAGLSGRVRGFARASPRPATALSDTQFAGGRPQTMTREEGPPAEESAA